MFIERVSKIMKKVFECPNQCGPMTFLKKRQSIIHMIPMELIENLDEDSEDMYGYLAGVCPECGFTLITDNKEAYK